MKEPAAPQGRVGPPARRHPIWGREIPFRNPHFVARERELADLENCLRQGSTALIGQPVQALYGLGGIGKTELAAEYAHRHREDYDLVWWIRAEREDAIAAALVALGQRLALTEARREERDHSMGVVMDALIAGDPFDRWLLIFDDAHDASVISQYIPQTRGHGHVIITSRDIRWQALRVDGIELKEFEPSESIEFLRKRVPALASVAQNGADQAAALAEEDRRRSLAAELAAELGNLPLALEHAAAYLKENGGVSVEEYLRLYRENAHGLLASDVDISYKGAGPVATTWSLSTHAVAPDATAVFQLLAFFGPEPVAEELLRQPGVAGLPDPIDDVVRDLARLRPALRELDRYSLVRIDGVRNVVQMHRVVQSVTRDRLRREDPERARELREAVHRLLAASDPLLPDRVESGLIYERSREHIVPSGALDSADPDVRRLVINQVRQLHLHGGYRESLVLGEQALAEWRRSFGPDDKLTLNLAVEVAKAMRSFGRWQDAYELDSATLAALREHYGEEDEIYLYCARSYGQDLSVLGRDQEALDSDQALLPLYERHLGPLHGDTLALRNNIAISLRCLGRFAEALEHDEAVLAARERMLGVTDHLTLVSQFAVGRDLRRLGRFEEALDRIRRVNEIMAQLDRPWTLFRLLVGSDLGLALRQVGQYEEARRQAEFMLERHYEVLGEDHRRSLQAETYLVSDRRLTGDLDDALKLGERNVAKWEKVAGASHPNTLGAQVNLANVLRMQHQLVRARELDERALAGLIALYGEDHPSTLAAMTNLASDLAAVGDVRRAKELGEKALEMSRRVRGPEHPSTLLTAANLALDRRAAGDEEGAHELREAILPAIERAFGYRHPQAQIARQEGRLTLDISPMAS